MRNARHALPGLLVLLHAAVATRLLDASPEPKKLLARFDAHQGLEQQGLTVSSAGDIDGDRISDVITGLRTQPSGSLGNHISARVYSGKTGDLLLELPAPPHVNDSPNPVASAGDLDGDGLAELIVGTPDAGVVRVYRNDGTILKPFGPLPAIELGASVAFAGDCNGDGVADFIVGAPARSQAFVFSGQTTGPNAFALLAAIDGPAESRFGSSVGTAGSIRTAAGDRRSAVVIGAPLATGRVGRVGQVFVYFIDNPKVPVFTLSGTTGHDLLGFSVDGGRDVNGDGTPDFLGAALGSDLSPPAGTGTAGKGYVRVWSGVDAQLLRQINSDQDGDRFGWSARFGGPCDGSRFTVIAGAPRAAKEPLAIITGRVRIHDALSGDLLSEIWGERAFDGMGISVAAFIDLNRDGHAEILAGAHGTRLLPDEFLMGGAAFVFSCVDVPRPDAIFEPDILSFGAVGPGGTKSVQGLLRNVGDLELKVQSLSIAPGSSGAFSYSGPGGPFLLAAGAGQPVTVLFAPQTPGVHGGKLRLHSNDPLEPTLDLPLGGKSQLVKIHVAPASVALGAVGVGESAGEILEVTNVGTEPLAVSSIDLDPSAGEVGLVALPQFPRLLGPAESFIFATYLAPLSGGPKGATIHVHSSDPASPVVDVPVTGSGAPPNLPPTAVIRMDVPYSRDGFVLQVPFRGNESFDTPPGPLSYAWAFGDFGTSSSMNLTQGFGCSGGGGIPCLAVVRLEVTDAGGKKDPTSVTVISFSRPIRSRFFGTIRQGGLRVPDGTVVEAWVNGQKLAESLTQTHHGESVYAIDVPPDPPGPGGVDNDEVVFKYNKATAHQSGIFYTATDQELDLTAPFYVPPRDYCVHAEALRLRVCGKGEGLPRPGLDLELDTLQPPVLDPGPLKLVGEPFELNFFEHGTGRKIESFSAPYTIALSYTPDQLAAAGVASAKTLRLHYAQGGRWVPAGSDELDLPANEILTTLDHASIFALLGEGSATAPMFRRGDADSNGKVELTDAVRILGHLFLGGARPACMDAGDADDGGKLDISDAVAILGFLFLGSKPPALPGPNACGVDVQLETPDLGCASTACR